MATLVSLLERELNTLPVEIRRGMADAHQRNDPYNQVSVGQLAGDSAPKRRPDIQAGMIDGVKLLSVVDIVGVRILTCRRLNAPFGQVGIVADGLY